MNDIDQVENAAQTPGAVDANLFSTLYCKELTVYGPVSYMYFDPSSFRFYIANYTPEDKYCDDIGIFENDMTPYRPKNFPVSTHVVYFQGTHDGATPAKGAVEMRHSFATHFMETTKDPIALKGILGHSTLKMTDKYAKVTDRTVFEGMEKFKTAIGKLA